MPVDSTTREFTVDVTVLLDNKIKVNLELEDMTWDLSKPHPSDEVKQLILQDGPVLDTDGNEWEITPDEVRGIAVTLTPPVEPPRLTTAAGPLPASTRITAGENACQKESQQ